MSAECRSRLVALIGVLLVAGSAAGAAALALPALRGQTVAGAGPAVTSAAGAIRLGNSLAGRAVIRAQNLLPGDTRRASVTISNPNRQPLRGSLALRLRGEDALARALRLQVLRPGRGSFYAGSLAEMGRLPLGEMAPGEAREYEFLVELPPGGGDELQGRSTTADLVWTAQAAGPPPKCRLRAMRARFFVFRRRNRIRLVSRYRARVPARVAIDFFERRPNGAPGRRVGTLRTSFKRRPVRWGRNRVARRRSLAEMRRFRRSRGGFVAQLRVSGAPGYCRQYLNLDLVQLKRFYGQYTWFQRGSFKVR